MTYSELLHGVRFDDLVPYIIKHHGHDGCLAWYKTHYDILCHMTPRRDADMDEDGNDVTTATISYGETCENGRTGHELLEAYPLEGGPWEVSLAKELVIAPGVTASREEIAACCLWHTSFNGFTPAQVESRFSEEDGTYAEEAKRIKTMYGSMVPSIRQMLRNKSFHNMVRSDMKAIRRYRFSKKDKEKGYIFMDRKRKWRMWKRECITSLYNSKIAGIGKAIEEMHRGESIIAPPGIGELCKKLFWGKRCHIVSHQTHANDAEKRFGDFKELIVKYDAYRPSLLPCAMACLSSSAAHPITMEEMELIALATQGCEEARYCVKVDDSLGKELRLSIAFYEELNPEDRENVKQPLIFKP